MRLILASASPRRRELLAAAGLDFEVAPADVDETLVHFAIPDQAAVELARRKARAGLAQLRAREYRDALLIGADTVVAVPSAAGWALLGKPANAAEATAMLGQLSNTRHAVITGVCVARAADGAEHADFERTWVRMRAITERERALYVASGEWRDKAGGYAIQETADAFVVGLEEGGFDNVVGLPVGLTLRLLREAGWNGTP